jgi:hypothetical protein
MAGMEVRLAILRRGRRITTRPASVNLLTTNRILHHRDAWIRVNLANIRAIRTVSPE